MVTRISGATWPFARGMPTFATPCHRRRLRGRREPDPIRTESATHRDEISLWTQRPDRLPARGGGRAGTRRSRRPSDVAPRTDHGASTIRWRPGTVARGQADHGAATRRRGRHLHTAATPPGDHSQRHKRAVPSSPVGNDNRHFIAIPPDKSGAAFSPLFSGTPRSQFRRPGPKSAECRGGRRIQGAARASVGERRAARMAGYRPATPPITRVAATPPAIAHGGTTVGQSWVRA
jgi:hypothetical protein